MNSEKQSSQDLQHFLRLALAQIQFRIGKEKAAAVRTDEIKRLQLLEDLVKEQVKSK